MSGHARNVPVQILRKASIEDFNEQVVNMLDDVERRVEQLREAAGLLEQEKETIIDMLTNVSLNTELLRLGQGDREDINATANRLMSRTKAVEVVVNTPRTAEQQKALGQVNLLIEAAIQKMHDDLENSKDLCHRFLNACNPDQPEGPIDQRFQASVIECTADDQKKIRRRLAQVIQQIDRAERTLAPQWLQKDVLYGQRVTATKMRHHPETFPLRRMFWHATTEASPIVSCLPSSFDYMALFEDVVRARFPRQVPAAPSMSRTLTLSLDAPTTVVDELGNIVGGFAYLVKEAKERVPGHAAEISEGIQNVINQLGDALSGLSAVFSSLPALLIINSVLLIIVLVLCIGLLVLRIINVFRLWKEKANERKLHDSSLRSQSYRRSVDQLPPPTEARKPSVVPSHQPSHASIPSAGETRPTVTVPRSESRNSRTSAVDRRGGEALP